MQKTMAVIEARTAAHRGAPLTRRLGGKSLLEWVIQRVRESARLDSLVVLLESGGARETVSDLLPATVPVFHVPKHDGQVMDGLARYVALLNHFPAAALVRVRATNPFLDAALIDRLIAEADEHPTCDYIGYGSQQDQPMPWCSPGEHAEWIRADAIRRADREAIHGGDRQQPTQWMRGHDAHFAGRGIPIPQPLDRGDVRLTIEHPEDWEHAEAIFDALGHDRLDWQHITGFLKHQPRLRERMADLNRRHTAA